MESLERTETKLPTTRLPQETPLAMCYVPYQTWEEPLTAEEALQVGTVFQGLNLPFLCDGGVRNE